MIKRSFIRNALALSAIAALGVNAAHAADPVFPPQKPVTLVVGFAAGGAADAAARLIAKKLGENIGQSVVVDNRGGAGGNIAHQQVASGVADGSVLLFGSVGPLTIAPHLMKLNYDPFKDLAPISGGVYFPNVLVVHKGIGVKTLAEFVAKSKAGNDYVAKGQLAEQTFTADDGRKVDFTGFKPDFSGIPASFCQHTFTADETAKLEAGEKIYVEGMISKKGNEFSATLSYGKKPNGEKGLILDLG